MTDWPPLPTVVLGIRAPIDVVRLAVILDDDGEELDGLWEYPLRRITVREALEPSVAWWTYWHEHTHAVLDDLCVELPGTLEEDVCNAIATARVLEMQRRVG